MLPLCDWSPRSRVKTPGSIIVLTSIEDAGMIARHQFVHPIENVNTGNQGKTLETGLFPLWYFTAWLRGLN